jgi:hypothetical protein
MLSMKRSAPDDVRDPDFDYTWPLEKNIIMGFPELDVHLAEDLMPPPRLETEPERDCDGINPEKRRERLANVDWHQHRRISRSWNDLQAALTDTDQKERFAQPAFADVLEYYVTNYERYKEELFAALYADTDDVVRLRTRALLHHARKIFYSLGRVFDSIVALKDDRSDDLFRRLTELSYTAGMSVPGMGPRSRLFYPAILLSPAWSAFVLGRYETSPSPATVIDCFGVFDRQVHDVKLRKTVAYVEFVSPKDIKFMRETMAAAAARDDLAMFDFIVDSGMWRHEEHGALPFDYVQDERARNGADWLVSGCVNEHVHVGPKFIRRLLATDFNLNWTFYALLSTRQALDFVDEITAHLDRFGDDPVERNDVLTAMMHRPLTKGVARFLKAVIPDTRRAPEEMLAWAAASMRLDLLEDAADGGPVDDETMLALYKSWNISAAAQADTVANPVSAANVLATLEFMRRRSLTPCSFYAAEKLRAVASLADWRMLLAHPLVKASSQLYDDLLRLVPDEDDAAALLVIDAFVAAFGVYEYPDEGSRLAKSASQRASKVAIRRILYGPPQDNVRNDIVAFIADDARIRRLRADYTRLRAGVRALAGSASQAQRNELRALMTRIKKEDKSFLSAAESHVLIGAAVLRCHTLTLATSEDAVRGKLALDILAFWSLLAQSRLLFVCATAMFPMNAAVHFPQIFEWRPIGLERAGAFNSPSTWLIHKLTNDLLAAFEVQVANARTAEMDEASRVNEMSIEDADPMREEDGNSDKNGEMSIYYGDAD